MNLNEHNVGKLARALACHSVFGTEVLKGSTVISDLKRRFKVLYKKKLTELCSIVDQQPLFCHLSHAIDFIVITPSEVALFSIILEHKN